MSGGQTREARAEYMRGYRARNLEKERARGRTSYQTHKDARLAAVKIYREAFPDKIREGKRAYKARRRSRIGSAPCVPSGRRDIEALEFCCQSCRGPAEHLDHIVPAAKGGCANVHNLQWLCAPCNWTKNAKTPEPYHGCPDWWGA